MLRPETLLHRSTPCTLCRKDWLLHEACVEKVLICLERRDGRMTFLWLLTWVRLWGTHRLWGTTWVASVLRHNGAGGKALIVLSDWSHIIVIIPKRCVATWAIILFSCWLLLFAPASCRRWLLRCRLLLLAILEAHILQLLLDFQSRFLELLIAILSFECVRVGGARLLSLIDALHESVLHFALLDLPKVASILLERPLTFF